jgi:hypothetical protein
MLGILNGLFPNDIQLGRIAIEWQNSDKENTFKFVSNKFPDLRKREGIYTHPDHSNYKGRGKEISLKELDVTGCIKKGYYWGYMTNFGNPISDEMWWEMKFVREFTESDRKSIGAFTVLAFEIDD